MILESYNPSGYITLKRWFFEVKKKDFANWGYEFIIEDENSDWVKVPISSTGAFTEKGKIINFYVTKENEYKTFGTFVPYKCMLSLEEIHRAHGNVITTFDPKTGEVTGHTTEAR